mgnify:FL=1
MGKYMTDFINKRKGLNKLLEVDNISPEEEAIEQNKAREVVARRLGIDPKGITAPHKDVRVTDPYYENIDIETKIDLPPAKEPVNYAGHTQADKDRIADAWLTRPPGPTFFQDKLKNIQNKPKVIKKTGVANNFSVDTTALKPKDKFKYTSRLDELVEADKMTDQLQKLKMTGPNAKNLPDKEKAKPMNIVKYINRMNSIYGKSEPEEQHPQDKFHEEQIKEIEKRGKSWLVKHLNKQDQETEVQKLAEDIKREKNKK